MNEKLFGYKEQNTESNNLNFNGKLKDLIANILTQILGVNI